MVNMRRHYVVPDLQIAAGDPVDHLEWIGKDIVRRRPDVVVVLGDVWQMDSLSTHSEPGSLEREGARISVDIDRGKEGLKTLMAPVHAEIRRLKRRKQKAWEPELIFLHGNHEYRISRFLQSDPRFIGILGENNLGIEEEGFEVHPFLEVVEKDGVHYSHYFQNEKTNKPIGGSLDNRLNKICASFVCGHEQGLLLHRRPLPTGKTIHGIVAGSCYLKTEGYRGAQRQNEWRGVVVLNDVRDGDFEPMPLTPRYLCREYTGMDLYNYMRLFYPEQQWEYLR